jgi:hypothetical protein
MRKVESVLHLSFACYLLLIGFLLGLFFEHKNEVAYLSETLVS